MLDAYIRADVALLPGLSGGALVNASGELVGMLSAHLAGGDPVAIPANTLDGIVDRILSGGSLRRAYLGVSSQPVELQELLRRSLGIEQTMGSCCSASSRTLQPNALDCSWAATSCCRSAAAPSRTARRCRWRSAPPRLAADARSHHSWRSGARHHGRARAEAQLVKLSWLAVLLLLQEKNVSVLRELASASPFRTTN